MTHTINKLFSLLIASTLLAACASNPSRLNDQMERGVPSSTLKPNEISFSVPEADIMYDILVAEIATQRGDTKVAAEFYTNAARKSNNAAIAARAVRIASFADEHQLALESAKVWVANDPDNLEGLRVLTVLYIRNGHPAEAKTTLSKMLAADPQKIARSLLHIGAMLQREATAEHAADISQYMVDLYPDYAESHYVNASLSLSANKPAQALTSIDKTLKINSTWLEAVTLRARVLIELERNEEALTYLKGYLDKHPESDAVRLAYARSLVDARKLQEARSQFELLAVKMPDNEDVLFTLAMLSMQFKEYKEAQGYLLQLDKMGKSSPQINYYMGQVAEQQEEDEVALEWYSKVDRSDYYLDSQLRIAAVLARAKSLDDALEHLHSIEFADNAEKREIVLFEGSLLRQEKQYEAAFKLYSKALKKDFPKDTDILYARALVAERLNMVDLAEKDLKFILDQEPDNAAAYNALGYTLGDRTNRLEEALKYVSKALELEPEDPAILDSLGWIYYRMGELKKALEYLSKAHKMIRDGEVAAHYGEILWATGDHEQAKKIWSEVKEEFGDNETLKQTLERHGQ